MSINNGTMNRIGAGGTLNTFGSVQSVDNTKIQELTEAIDSATESIQEGKSAIDNTVQTGLDTISVSGQTVLQTINNTATTVTDTLNNTVQEAVQTVSDEVDSAKQEISTAATTVVQYDVPVICPKEDVGCVLIKNAELGDTETIEVLRPTGEPTTTPNRIGTSLADCSLINVGNTLAHWKEYGATEVKFGYQADDYCYRDALGSPFNSFNTVVSVLGTIDRAQPVIDIFEFPEDIVGTNYVCRITPTKVESSNKSTTTQAYTIEVTDDNIALYADVWFGVYTYNLTAGATSWFNDFAAKYGTVWVTTANGEVVSYTGKPIDFSQFVNVGVVSDAYNPSKPYIVGEYCIYLKERYKCIANTTAGILPTNTTYFVKAKIDNEVSELNSNINNIKHYKTHTFPLCVNQSFAANATMLTRTIQVNKGDRLIISCVSFHNGSTANQFTRKLSGTVGGSYFTDAVPHQWFYSGGVLLEMNCNYNETLTFAPYTNIATQMTFVITIMREM